MNIPGRNLLSLTVYHLRRVVRLVIGSPVIDDITVNPDGSVVVGGSGGTPGQTIVITFPDGSVGTGVVGNGGGWAVVSPGPVLPVPNPEDLIVDQVPTPVTPTVPEPGEVLPGEGGGTVVGGGGATPGDDVEVTLPGGETGSGEAGEDGEWEVEFPDVPYDPDLDPGDVGVITTPKPGEPVVEDVTPNPDGSVTVGGGGANPGDQVTVTFPDGSTGTGTADEDGDWTVTSPGAQSPDLGADDVTVVAKPDPMTESVSAPDAVYADIAGMEFVEVDDDGDYIAWEQFMEALKKYIGVSETPSDSGYLKYYSGYPKDVIRHDGMFISQYDYVYKFYSGSADAAIEVTSPKNYMTPRVFGLFKTANSAYFLKAVGEANVLTRYDGVETSIVFNYVDNNLAVMADAGGKDWFFGNGMSYFIDPVTLSVTVAPIPADLELVASCSAGSAGGRVFVEGRSSVDGYITIRVLDSELNEVARIPNGRFICGDKYVYVKAGQGALLRYDAASLELTTLASNVAITSDVTCRHGFSSGDFAIFYGSQNDKSMMTNDGGVTWSALSLGNPYIAGMDIDSGELIVGGQFGEVNGKPYNFARFMLIEQ